VEGGAKERRSWGGVVRRARPAGKMLGEASGVMARPRRKENDERFEGRPRWRRTARDGARKQYAMEVEGKPKQEAANRVARGQREM
jgi:hypothetical protein